MPLLVILISILVVRGVTLPGALEGIKWYITPDFKALANPMVWMGAYSQIFFSLSLAQGVIIAYSSYLPENADITSNSLIIGLANCLFSVFVGFAIFGILGHMVYVSGLPINEVVQSGIGLAFVVFPAAINTLPFLPQFFGALFFLALFFAGLTSAVSIIEAFTAGLIDIFNVRRKKWVTILCMMGFFGGMIFTTRSGIVWLDIIDHFLLSYGLVVVGLLEIIIVVWIFGAKKVMEHAKKMAERTSLCQTVPILCSFLKFLAPLLLILMLAFTLHNEILIPYGSYPRSATVLLGFGWLIFTLIVAFLLSKLKSE